MDAEADQHPEQGPEKGPDPNPDPIQERIGRLVALQLGRKRVAAGDRIVEDLGAESLDVVNVIARVEEVYGITIEEEELPELRTVAELAECVRRRVA
jgi:acyl carrier protein